MKIKGILTERKDWYWRSAQIVTEWEDVLSKKMNIPVYEVKKIFHFFFKFLNKFRLGWLFLWIDSLRPIRAYYLYFDMLATTTFQFASVKNIIPIIIDFWLQKSELKEFYKNHANCKLILVSSKEVYDFLKENKCPLSIIHFPLSLPDKYISSDLVNYVKTIDFLFAGRKDPIFWDYIKCYEKENPDIEYVYQELEGRIPHYISNKRGKLTEDYYSREGYTKLLRSAKIAFYTTPGNDPSKEAANGFNQVTPRFLELLSSGCLIMGRYPDNPDVDYYQLNKICPKVNSYQDFKRIVVLFSEGNFVKEQTSMYYSYLLTHSTSARVVLLEKILKSNSFTYNKK